MDGSFYLEATVFGDPLYELGGGFFIGAMVPADSDLDCLSVYWTREDLYSAVPATVLSNLEAWLPTTYTTTLATYDIVDMSAYVTPST